MVQFDKIFSQLIHNPHVGMDVIIHGKNKKLNAMIRLSAKNYLMGEYIKAMFQDGSYILIIPQDKEIYYSHKYRTATGIPDKSIGKDEIVEFEGKKYKLGNKDDYQYVLELMVGSPLDIEGECRFSDYFLIEGEKEILSLGWITQTGKRADIHCKLIDLTEIQVC